MGLLGRPCLAGSAGLEGRALLMGLAGFLWAPGTRPGDLAGQGLRATAV